MSDSNDAKFEFVKNIFIALWVVTSVAIGFYALTNNWQEASQRDTAYQALGWKQLDSKIVQLSEVNGNFKPVSQTATLEYKYIGELPVQTQQQIALGYHKGDNVGIYANKNGEVQVVNAPDPNRTSHYLPDPRYDNSFNDYLGSIISSFFVAVFAAFGLFIAFVVLIAIAVGISILLESIVKSNKNPTVAT